MAALSAVCITPFPSRFHDLDGLDDVICVVTLGDPFDYVIPSFDTLTVKLRQMKIWGYGSLEGEEVAYDVFVREDPSLHRTYPAWMAVKDLTCIKVDQ